jgi:HD superfamily phosphodiesterase
MIALFRMFHAMMDSDGVDCKVLRAFLHDIGRVKQTAPGTAHAARAHS